MAAPAPRRCCLGWDFSTQQVLPRALERGGAACRPRRAGWRAGGGPGAGTPLRRAVGVPSPLRSVRGSGSCPTTPCQCRPLARGDSDQACTPVLPETAAYRHPHARGGILQARGGQVPRGARGPSGLACRQASSSTVRQGGRRADAHTGKASDLAPDHRCRLWTLSHPWLAPACPSPRAQHCWLEDAVCCPQDPADGRAEGNLPSDWVRVVEGLLLNLENHHSCSGSPLLKWVREAGLGQFVTTSPVGHRTAMLPG